MYVYMYLLSSVYVTLYIIMYFIFIIASKWFHMTIHGSFAHDQLHIIYMYMYMYYVEVYF